MTDLNDEPFQEFDSIKTIANMTVSVTEKIHGTNAHVMINDDSTQIRAASRNRWLTVEDDNYGFARWVHENREALIAFLGPGRHYGEWYGSGIGPGYDMKEKRFALFNTYRWKQVADKLPARVDLVPIIYAGPYSPQAIEETMAKLKAGGSVLVPGYMKPEGVVIFFSAFRAQLKQVFNKEETGWDRKDVKDKAPVEPLDPAIVAQVDALLQPIRLEKLLMKDERLVKEYPKTIGAIAKSYLEDLVKESEPIDAIIMAEVKKRVFSFIKANPPVSI